MANSFKSYVNTSITTEATVYTGPTSTEATIIGMSIANTSGNPTYVDVKLNSAYVIKGAPIASGGALVVVGGDQKVVVEDGDIVTVTADEIVDVVTSVLEIS